MATPQSMPNHAAVAMRLHTTTLGMEARYHAVASMAMKDIKIIEEIHELFMSYSMIFEFSEFCKNIDKSLHGGCRRGQEVCGSNPMEFKLLLGIA